MSLSLQDLEKEIGYEFKDKTLLRHALTHSSYINEHGMDKVDSNERLEFLGDAVLEMVSSEFLFQKYPNRPEGELTKLRASLVCEPTLAQSAREISLGAHLIMGKGMELGGGRESEAITSDAFEALIAALFLDGGLAPAKELILKFVMNDIENKRLFYDSKTVLQEILQPQKKTVTYELLKEEGPEHAKSFQVAAFIDGVQYGVGIGKSKKHGQQMAAYETILMIRNQ